MDAALIAGSLSAALYLTLNLDVIVSRAGAWSGTDVLAGTVAVVTLLEASRRALGWPISFIAACFIGYGYVGPFLPGVLRHGGYSTGRLVGQLYLGQEGMYGIPLGVAASFVFVFILFGALLEVTGAGQFFIDLAYALTGRQRGGPAKAAVLASAAMGSVSGSAIANVVTSGAFTIPLMKKVGYRPEEAGGIEAAASTGGQILPPIMGAGAFLIAEYTALPYLEVVKAGARSRDSLHGNGVRLRASGGGGEESRGPTGLRAPPVRDHVSHGLALPGGASGSDDRPAHGFFGGPGRLSFVRGSGCTGGLASRMGPIHAPHSKGL